MLPKQILSIIERDQKQHITNPFTLNILFVTNFAPTNGEGSVRARFWILLADRATSAVPAGGVDILQNH